MQDILQRFARLCQTGGVYGSDHARTMEAADEVFAGLGPVLSGPPGRLNISLRSNGLFFNGRPADAQSVAVRQVVARMTAMQINGFALVRGVSREEFRKLVRLLFTEKGGAFAAGVRQQLHHVVTAQLEEQERWSDSRPEVRKAPVAAGSAAAGGPARSGPPAAPAGAAAAGGAGGHPSPGRARTLNLDAGAGSGLSDSRPQVQQILAFIKGHSGAVAPSADEDLAEIAGDPQKLAALILEATAIRQSQTDVSGETVVELVLGCLRRTFTGLRGLSERRPDVRPELRRALLLLEKNLLDRFHALMGRADTAADAAIAAAVREQTADLEVDSLVREYVEQRAAITRSERRIMDFIRSQGAPAAAARLEGAGLPAGEWERLLAVGGSSGSPGAGGGMDLPQGLGTLAVLLEKFDLLLRSEQAHPEDVRRVIGDLNGSVAALASTTRRRMDELHQDLHAGSVQSWGEHLSRNELLARLAEIAQELLQPLTVISCALSMILDGHVGSVDLRQKDLLQMAGVNTERLRDLMDRLIRLVGYPTGLHADRRLIENEPRPPPGVR